MHWGKQKYFTKGAKFLMTEVPSLEKVTIWWKTLSQFYKYRNFDAVFLNAGYGEYRISPKFMRNGIDYANPDLIAWTSEGKWMLLELTTNPHPDNKDFQLGKYEKITPLDVGNSIGPTVQEDPEILLISTHSFLSGYCHIVFENQCEISNIERLRDPRLIEGVNAMEAKDFSRPPRLFFSVVPEMNHYELKCGIVASVRKLFTQSESSMSAEDMAEECLDSISNYIEIDEKKKIVKDIDLVMGQLTKKYLGKYLVCTDGKYRAKTEIKSQKSREAISKGIKDWMNDTKSSQTVLDSF